MKARENETRHRSCYSRVQGEGESKEAWNEKVKQMLQHSTVCFRTSCVASYYIIKCAEMWNKMCCHLKAYVYVYGVFERLTITQLALLCPNSISCISDVLCDFFCVKVLSGGAGDWTTNPAINGRAAPPSPSRVQIENLIVLCGNTYYCMIGPLTSHPWSGITRELLLSQLLLLD